MEQGKNKREEVRQGKKGNEGKEGRTDLVWIRSKRGIVGKGRGREVRSVGRENLRKKERKREKRKKESDPQSICSRRSTASKMDPCCLRDDKWTLSLWHGDHFSWMLTAQFLLSLLHVGVWHTPWHQSNLTWQGCQPALSHRSPHHNTLSPTKVNCCWKILPPGSTLPELVTASDAETMIWNFNDACGEVDTAAAGWRGQTEYLSDSCNENLSAPNYSKNEKTKKSN